MKAIIPALLVLACAAPAFAAPPAGFEGRVEGLRKETGVPVPMPGDERSLTEALMKAVLLRRREVRQASFFDIGLMDEAKRIDRAWTDAAENEKKSRTVFMESFLRRSS